MKEYEYSFKVNDLQPYIEYCKNNKYEKAEETMQTRTLYRNKNKTMARITAKEKNGVEKALLDFKDDNKSSEILKVSRETIPLTITDDNKEAIESILDMLEYTKDTVLVRKREVYQKGNVTFEIDDYSSPEVMYVVAIEGEKELVDKVYEDLEKNKRKF